MDRRTIFLLAKLLASKRVPSFTQTLLSLWEPSIQYIKTVCYHPLGAFYQTVGVQIMHCNRNKFQAMQEGVYLYTSNPEDLLRKSRGATPQSEPTDIAALLFVVLTI